jgi:hypothetical protein
MVRAHRSKERARPIARSARDAWLSSERKVVGLPRKGAKDNFVPFGQAGSKCVRVRRAAGWKVQSAC